MTNQIIKIKNETYGLSFWWVKAKSDDEFNTILFKNIPTAKDQMEIDDDGTTLGETINLIHEGHNIICFWFQERNFPAMTHELLHATIICLRIKGVKLLEESEEAYCYLFDWLITQILKRQCKKQPVILKNSK